MTIDGVHEFALRMNWIGSARWRIRHRQKNHRRAYTSSARDPEELIQAMLTQYVPEEKRKRPVAEPIAEHVDEDDRISRGDAVEMPMRDELLTVVIPSTKDEASASPPQLSVSSNPHSAHVLSDDGIPDNSSEVTIDECVRRIERLEATVKSLVHHLLLQK